MFFDETNKLITIQSKSKKVCYLIFKNPNTFVEQKFGLEHIVLDPKPPFVKQIN